MKKLFYSLVLIQGIGFSTVFGVWSLKDYFALEHAVAVGAQHAEMRHRISNGFDGVWFLLSEMLVLASIKELSSNNKKEN